MKKKITSLCLVVALLAIAIVGGTLAYFTDTDEATNTATFGNVKIEQWEQERDGSEFVQDQNIFPAVLSKLTKSDITVNGYTFPIRSLEGNYVDKIVSVKNTGTNDAYVRTIIAVPSINGYDDSEDASFNPLHWNYLDATDFNGTGYDWNGSNDAAVAPQTDKIQDVNIGGVMYDLYIGTYTKALPAGTISAPAMTGFYLHDTVGYGVVGQDDAGNDVEGYYFVDKQGVPHDLTEWIKADAETDEVTMKILVASQACQTAGFADAWEALDAAFGDITATNHPWAE